jgi:fructose-specific phosphotransferase system IIC component
MGIHTAWNFTQNLLFGLPNSGLVSEVSVFKMDAMNAQSNLIYNYDFGVEGAIPAVLADALLGIICLILAAKKGRLKELGMRYDELHPQQHRYISEKEKAIMNAS